MYQKIFYIFMTIIENGVLIENKRVNKKNKVINILPR